MIIFELQRITFVVTDNTKANQAAWKSLEDTFPDKFFYGCVAHLQGI